MSTQDVQIAAAADQDRTRGGVLTERDRRILLLLGEYGCVSADRIKAIFWNDNPTRTHYRRLGVLKRMNLIENVQGDGANPIGYRLTKKGKERYSAMFGKETPKAVRRGYKTQFEHDQLLINVRHILQASPLVKNFKAEAEIHREIMSAQAGKRHWEEMPTIPDAIFKFETPGQNITVAVELELTPKVRSRYVRIFRNHLLSKDWGLVLYIVKDLKFQERLMKLLNDIKASDVHVQIAKAVNGIYFCSLEYFLEQRLEAPMTNGKKEVSLEQIAKNFGLKTPGPR